MEFIEPVKIGFTVYGKSGCNYCTKTKNLLKEKNLTFFEVDCDEYLIEEKDNFLSFVQNKIGKSYNTFPMIFYNGQFIGGFNETSDMVSKLILSFEELF